MKMMFQLDKSNKKPDIVWVLDGSLECEVDQFQIPIISTKHLMEKCISRR